uniref:F-box domain-containing protein n=1 Tax=Caenorhabditis tropicalis TaxID=1561998 RepID=A0A1I7UTL4_9PELO
MDLLRIPLLVLIDVFKNMDFREKFLISLMSKRARNTLKLTCVIPHFSIKFSNDMYIHSKPVSWVNRSTIAVEASDLLIGGEEMRLSLYPDGTSLQEQSIEKQLILADHVFDTFIKSSISIKFFDPTPSLSAWEFMKMLNDRQLIITLFSYYITSASSEYIPKILDECTEVTDSISMHAAFPEDFVYTPPYSFIATELHVSKRTNWLNLKSFMSCSRIFLEGVSNWTPEFWNTFFKNWIESESRLQYLSCISKDTPKLQLIIDGLSNEMITRIGKNEWIEVKRRDGSEFFIGKASNHLYMMSKEEHRKERRIMIID